MLHTLENIKYNLIFTIILAICLLLGFKCIITLGRKPFTQYWFFKFILIDLINYI
jgi:hypothetical protein